MDNFKIRKDINFVTITLIFLSIYLIIFSNIAYAKPLETGETFVGLLDLIEKQANTWYFKLHEYAFRLFWLLATLQLLWTFIPLLFKQSDIAEFVGEFVKFILVIGFFAALLEYSRDWSTAIVNSLRTAAAHASGRTAALRPGDIFHQAVSLADTVVNVWNINPLVIVFKYFAALVVLLCFAFIGAFMAVTLVESYIVINASVLFMGFGSSQWTRDMTITAFRYAISVGAKLFILTLIVTLIIDSTETWKKAYEGTSASMWTLIGIALVCAYLSKTIPDIISGLITGSSSNGGSTIGSMASAAVGAAVGAAAALATGGTSAAASGAGEALGGVSGSMGGGMSGGGAMMGAGSGAGSGVGGMTGMSNSINASQMTGNSFKDSGGSSQISENPRVSGGKNNSAGTNQFNPQSTAQTMKGVANVGVKFAGTMASLCVPGMEGAENLSLNAPPTPPETEDTQFSMDVSQPNETETSDMNTISGASTEKAT
ncbi:P-type conjugative transfer protein TrbL [Bartonella harrusi]|uniref:P-type conjugative transfer protein TrbL n=1 Tax=Bartonella harrusi TaxID=2961895 RepID=A0ABY5ETD6_9HYPH|nr:P-type conjugative transfer protein TrbL [Bartonella harrusi]UTO27685.1 P-type conjugative transfer protein TrbL [Bartonella harrusi]